MLIQILTPGFASPNGRAFLFPFVVWRDYLASAGIAIRFVKQVDQLTDSDVIIVDSKFHRDMWETEVESILADFQSFRTQTDLLIYSDTTDSSGWLQAELLSEVDKYWKFQLLADRDQYLRPMYGHRIYADYYFRTKGVQDENPEWSKPVTDRGLLRKLSVSWNSGLADYSLMGPYRMGGYMRCPVKRLLSFPEKSFVSPERERTNAISCRFGVDYPRASVAWQRKEIREILRDKLSTVKLSRWGYFSELKNSRVIVSPFGFGEITLKDFEVFLTGGVLLKPDMRHLETWPDLFRSGETMLSHSWDLSDLEEILEFADDNYRDLLAIAEEGQRLYARHIGRSGHELFVERLHSLLQKKILNPCMNIRENI